MAEENPQQEDKTEDATQERRDDFRERGQIAVSQEATAVIVLASTTALVYYAVPTLFTHIEKLLISEFQGIKTPHRAPAELLHHLGTLWLKMLVLVIPVFLAAAVASVAMTFLQTRFGFSWQRLEPTFSKMNPISGMARMFNHEALAGLLKTLMKMSVVAAVTYGMLQSEWVKIPGLMLSPMTATWTYFGSVTARMFWGVSALLVVVGVADYLYNWWSLERQMRMTKQEVKEEYKRRETDPMIKARMRRMQRDIANRKTVEKTKEATVLITNPTHYSIAIKYEFGMPAPIVVAKGVDFLALKMREVAKEKDIMIVENKPLARTLFKLVEVGSEIPESLFVAVSEVIRYVFQARGIKIPTKTPKVAAQEIKIPRQSEGTLNG